jgi:hypothetical protein
MNGWLPRSHESEESICTLKHAAEAVSDEALLWPDGFDVAWPNDAANGPVLAEPNEHLHGEHLADMRAWLAHGST